MRAKTAKPFSASACWLILEQRSMTPDLAAPLRSWVSLLSRDLGLRQERNLFYSRACTAGATAFVRVVGRLPVIGVRRCTEAGVRKASKIGQDCTPRHDAAAGLHSFRKARDDA